MNCLVIFAFWWGPGQILPLFCFIICHIVLMAGIHARISYLERKRRTDAVESYTKNKFEKKTKFLQHCFASIINGLANVFIFNYVYVSFNKAKRTKRKSRESFARQTVADVIFLIENIICVIFGSFVVVEPLNNETLKMRLISTIFVCHFLGLILKIVYYKHLHIWKELTPEFTRKERTIKRKFKNTKFYAETKDVDLDNAVSNIY